MLGNLQEKLRNHMRTARDTYNRFWELVGRGDFDGIRELASPNFLLHLPSQPPLPLPQAIEAAKAWRRAFSDFGQTQKFLESFESSDGRHFAAVVQERLSHDGDFEVPGNPVLPATYNDVDIQSNHVFTVDDTGHMTEWYIQFDTAALAAQMGAPTAA